MKSHVYKTKDVANTFHVTTGTVLKWVKKHDIPFSVNQYGHYCFEEKHLSLFEDIKNQNQKHYTPQAERKETVSAQQLTDKMAGLEEKIKIVERMVSNKADDIVSFQLREHRKEVQDINKRLRKIEERLYKIEETSKGWKEEAAGSTGKKDKRRIANLLSVMKTS
ncbi:chromosome-anchoring protein RacA [Alteribacillus persepolensis]|uniref:Chromosome-anchoring protein RacA n=1 Tax=Alteribacillus persepolensis TaxID=568899 RepID=A0A1G7ZBZ4_9BACI|nr:MerR family transcriptional regulator [Alteribacillus persepolensis]SDH06204.1 chromosome-anchoring protein RacA [Alteribacillus persepolensis]